MPLYEYRCDACEHQFEIIQSFSDKPVRKCEKCGGKVRKLISRAGFVLKGGGWYKSDYAPSKPSKEGDSSSDAPAAAEGKEPGAGAPAAAAPEPAAKPEPAAATASAAKGTKRKARS